MHIYYYEIFMKILHYISENLLKKSLRVFKVFQICTLYLLYSNIMYSFLSWYLLNSAFWLFKCMFSIESCSKYNHNYIFNDHVKKAKTVLDKQVYNPSNKTTTTKKLNLPKISCLKIVKERKFHQSSWKFYFSLNIMALESFLSSKLLKWKKKITSFFCILFLKHFNFILGRTFIKHTILILYFKCWNFSEIIEL